MYVCTYAYVCLRMLVSIHVGIASTFFLWMCYREQVNLIGHWSNTRCPVLCWNPPSGTCPKVSIYIPYLRSSRTTATAIITITITNITTKEFKFLHVLSPPVPSNSITPDSGCSGECTSHPFPWWSIPWLKSLPNVPCAWNLTAKSKVEYPSELLKVDFQ